MKLLQHRLSATLQLWLKLTSRQQCLHASQQGLTLIESLVAVVMIGVAISATLPPLFVATATRVQNRRVEQAMQIAQSEVDRVRTLVEQGDTTGALLPQNVGGDDVLKAEDYAPAGGTADGVLFSPNADCLAPPTELDATKLLPVDIDGAEETENTCDAEFLMQVFRVDTSGAQGLHFEVGVRVYASSVEGQENNLETTMASLKLTTGTGQQTLRPLATLYSTITKADQEATSLCPFYNLPGCSTDD